MSIDVIPQPPLRPAQLIVGLNRVTEPRGTLVELDFRLLPFVPSRCFIVRDVPAGTIRGGHAHRTCRQILLCLAGRIRVAARASADPEQFVLERPDDGLFIDKGVWASQTYETAGAVLLVLASDPYDPDSHIA